MNAILRPKCVMHVCGISVLILVSGCIEQSTVVKVKQDGSGLIHLRQHAQNVTLFGSKGNEKTTKVPSQAQIDLAIEEMGGNVQFVSLVKSKNRSGWSGYDLILKFADVNKLIVPSSLSKTLGATDSSEIRDAAKQAIDDDQPKTKSDPLADSMRPGYRFTMSDDQLEIHSFGYSEGESALQSIKDAGEGAVDPFASEPKNSPASVSFSDVAFQELAVKMLAEARVGFFVQVDGKVTESNAKYRKGNLITLVEMRIGEMMKREESVAMLKKLSKKKGESMTRAQAAELDTIEGLNLDAQEKIIVKFE